MASRIKGITIEIGGDTKGLDQALSGVNKQIKTTQSELRDVERLLKLDPTNTELLRQKQQLLAKAVSGTEEKLETLKDAERQAQEQFKQGKISEDQYNALKREIIATEQSLQKLTESADESVSVFEKLGEVSESIAGGAGKIAEKTQAISTAATAALAGFGALAIKTAETAKELKATSSVTGVGVEALQAYGYAAQTVNIPIETLTDSMKDSLAAMADARDETSEQAQIFKTLGINVKDADGNLRDAETVYWEVIDALHAMENETERDATAMKLLGESAREINPVVEMGADRFRELSAEAESLGLVLDEETLDSLADVNSELEQLKAQGTATLTKAGAKALQSFSPIIEDVVEALGGLLEYIGDLDESQIRMATSVLAVIAAISPVAKIVGGIATAIKGVSVALGFLSANPIIAAVGAVGLLTAGIVSMATEAKVSAEAADDLMTTLKEGGEQLDGTIENIEATASTADRLIDRLDVLNQDGLDESEAAEYNQILSTLCETVPELASLIDLETGAIEGGTEALRANTNAWRLNAKQQAYQDRLSELYKENSDALVELQMNTIALAEAKQDLAIAEANETAIRAELTAAYNGNGESIGYLQQKLSEAQGAQAQASSEIERYTELVNQGNIAVDAAAAEIAAEEAAIESLISAESSLTESTTEVVEAQEAVGEAVESTAMSVEDLAAKYAEAYNSAYSSLKGQVGLFDTFTGEIDSALASTSGMTAAWGEQSANLSAYAENLRLAAVYGIDDGLIASLADGSAESAEYLDQIIEEIEAAGVTTEGLGEDAQAFVREFNDAFRQTQTAREQLAAVMAGIETELAETLPEGQAFGNDLVQGMINGINNKSGTLYATMYRTVTEALQSGRRAARSNSPSKETIDLFEDVGEGMIIGMQHKEQDVASAVYDTVSRALALDPHRAAQNAGVSIGAMTGNMLGGASVQNNNQRTIQVSVQNSFGEYDSATGNAVASDLIQQINRALGRAY